MLKKDKLFVKIGKILSLDEERELAYKRAKRLIEYDFLPDLELMTNPLAAVAYQDAVCSYDPAILQINALSMSVSDRGRV